MSSKQIGLLAGLYAMCCYIWGAAYFGGFYEERKYEATLTSSSKYISQTRGNVYSSWRLEFTLEETGQITKSHTYKKPSKVGTTYILTRSESSFNVEKKIGVFIAAAIVVIVLFLVLLFSGISAVQFLWKKLE